MRPTFTLYRIIFSIMILIALFIFRDTETYWKGVLIIYLLMMIVILIVEVAVDEIIKKMTYRSLHLLTLHSYILYQCLKESDVDYSEFKKKYFNVFNSVVFDSDDM